MSDERTLILRQVDQIHTDIANLESGLEVIMAQLARQKGDLARVGFGIILCTSVITTIMTWWLIVHPQGPPQAAPLPTLMELARTAIGSSSQSGLVLLLPIRIDNAPMSAAEPGAVQLRDRRNIDDFQQQKKPPECQQSLDRLLRDLKSSAVEQLAALGSCTGRKQGMSLCWDYRITVH